MSINCTPGTASLLTLLVFVTQTPVIINRECGISSLFQYCEYCNNCNSFIQNVSLDWFHGLSLSFLFWIYLSLKQCFLNLFAPSKGLRYVSSTMYRLLFEQISLISNSVTDFMTQWWMTQLIKTVSVLYNIKTVCKKSIMSKFMVFNSRQKSTWMSFYFRQDSGSVFFVLFKGQSWGYS